MGHLSHTERGHIVCVNLVGACDKNCRVTRCIQGDSEDCFHKNRPIRAS
jgi:hypothetical protein